MTSLPAAEADAVLAEIKLLVPSDLQRAFQRCLLLLAHESGRDRLDLMREMVEDFLRRHGC
ncbi:MAG: hypothetical protein BWK76_00590 [Desulfobulbaceae bacterium A2]|nr:MAG: hypothetical protein BWK76_00590 [Desulfobulbaceae bacterium A2]